MGETPVSQHFPASHLRPAPPAARTQVPSTHYQVPKALLITGVFVASSKKKGLWSIVCPLPLLHNWNIARSLRDQLLERFFVTLPLFLEAYTEANFLFSSSKELLMFLFTCSLYHTSGLNYCLHFQHTKHACPQIWFLTLYDLFR